MTNLGTLGPELRSEFGPALSGGVELRALMLVSEVGELAKEVMKGSAYGTKPFETTAAFEEELGDTFVDLALLAEEAGVSLEACVTLTVEKMRRRLEEKGRVSSEALREQEL